MKKETIRTLLIGIWTLFMSMTISAQDFEYGGVCYTIIDENSVSVSNGSGYFDDIVIPSSIIHNGHTYSVTQIGNAAFDRNRRLKSLVIPNSVKTIGYRAFNGCWNLVSIVFPDNLESMSGCAIEGTAWYNNQPNGLIYIGKMVYKYKGTMAANTNISIKDGTRVMSDSVFYNCSNLISVTIPNSVTSIGRAAFFRCSNLTSITIPYGVTSIGSCAFNDCSRLTYVDIPNSVKTIGNNAFQGTAWYDYQPNGLVYVGNVAYKYKGEMPAQSRITLKSGTLGISDNAFSGCSGLASITIPNGVTEIGCNAFQECSGLTTLTIPNSVISIGEGAFRYCDNLKTISLPNSVSSIGPSAFYGCSKLSSIDIPSSVTTIGNWTFEKCSGLTSITIPSSVTSIGYSAFSGCSSLKSIAIPNSVTSIGNYAFTDCSSLTSISLPNTLTYVGYNAFQGTAWYNNQPDGLIYVGKIAFKYKGTMPANTNIAIKDGTVGIAGSAFSSCSGLTSVSIPNSVTSIGISAFSSCSGLTYINLPSSITEIASSAFSSCSGLLSIVIPDRVTSIQRSTFSGCSSLISVTLPYGLISIGRGAFSSCNSLNSLTIPGSVTSIGNIFYWSGVKSLKSIVSEIERPFVINDTIAFSCPSDVELIVPYGTKTAYQATEGWNKFNKITEAANKDEVLFTIDGVTYQGSKSAKTGVAKSVDTSRSWLEIPASVSYDGIFYQVTGLENNTFDGCSFGALIWDVDAALPNNAFSNASIGSNFLLYVKSASYAPSSIKNVVVNGTASSVQLSDDGGQFFCPQAFTARSISYTHNYSMETGNGQPKGWETIALPFDVQRIVHSTRGEIVPFASYNSTSNQKPFWLANMSASGFRRTSTILAYDPYIIAMPNNSNYRNDYNLSGDVTFSSENVQVPKTPTFSGTFLPAYAIVAKSSTIYALNVNNRYVKYSGSYDAGSRFISNLRDVRPFEAYMTGSSSTRGVIEITFDDGMTDMDDILLSADEDREINIYALSGQQVARIAQRDFNQVWTDLPKGVYIVNGMKRIK